MTSIGGALRRTLLLVVLAAAVGAVVSWRRGQTTTPTPAAPPQWPPWPERPAAPVGAASTAATVGDAQSPATPNPPEPTALADGEHSWVPAHADGSAPDSHPIKVKVSSGIFHVPGGRFYERTRADRCYPTAAAAEADGYRRSKT